MNEFKTLWCNKYSDNDSTYVSTMSVKCLGHLGQWKIYTISRQFECNVKPYGNILAKIIFLNECEVIFRPESFGTNEIQIVGTDANVKNN